MIYILGVIALIIFSGIMFQKQLRLSLIRMRYGKYSFQYVKQFKKYANKSPFPYCFKDDIMPYLRISAYAKDKIDRFESDNEIYFEGEFFNAHLTEVIQKYGKPGCFNAFFIKNKELRVCGYQKMAFGTQVKAAFFFLNELLIMGEYIIDDLSKVDINAISAEVMNQCGIQEKKSVNHFVINSKNDTSVLFYENGFSAIIRYFNHTNDDFAGLIK